MKNRPILYTDQASKVGKIHYVIIFTTYNFLIPIPRWLAIKTYAYLTLRTFNKIYVNKQVTEQACTSKPSHEKNTHIHKF